MAEIENQKRLEFHIEKGDYFGTLATILDLIRQEIESRERKGRITRVLEKLKDDLLYLQDHYKIIEKSQ